MRIFYVHDRFRISTSPLHTSLPSLILTGILMVFTLIYKKEPSDMLQQKTLSVDFSEIL